MSALGLGNFGAISLAGSLAGSQRSDADRTRARGDAADQRQLVDRTAVPLAAPGNIGEAEFSTDRDADGRLLYTSPPQDEADDRETHFAAALRASRQALDPDGERGQRLDLEA
jgi:hypothetical protein